MLKYLKRIVVLWIVFIVLAVAGGGGSQFRSMHEKAEGITLEIIDALAAKADSVKEDADSLKESILSLVETKKDLAKNLN